MTASPGLYLMNASGDMTAVHTEDGGDLGLLREYLQEEDLAEYLCEAMGQ